MVRPFRLGEDDAGDETEPLIADDNNFEATVRLQSIDAILPDDCLHAIFEFLPLKDLHGFGRTCRRNSDSVKKYLNRENKTKSLDIKMINGGVMIGSNREWLGSHIAILKMHTNNINAWTIIARRFENVNKIIFNKNYVPKSKITPEHGIVLGNILQEAKSIEFKRNAFADEHGEHILNHCQKLKHLVIGTKVFKRTDKFSHIWMEKKYPTLEEVQFDFGFPYLVSCDDQGEKIRNFFNNNKGIKHLTILTNIESSLDFIFDNDIRFEKLTIRLESNVIGIIDSLNDLQISGKIQRYGLIFKDTAMLDSNAQLINELNGIESVYMKKCSYYDWANNYPEFFNKLKVLHIGDISPEGAQTLASNAVNLEEIYIECGSITIIDTFVNHAAKLKKIVFYEVAGSMDDFSWINLIRGRIALAEPSQLYIYVPESAYIPIKWKEWPSTLNLTEAIPRFYSGMIEIKRVESLMPYRPY